MLTKAEVIRDMNASVRTAADFNLPGVTAATAANYQNFFVAPFPCRVVSIVARFSAAGGAAAAVQITKAPSGTSTDAGTNVLTTPLDLTGATHTNVNGVLSTVASATVLNTGDALGAVDSGTLTGLADLSVTVMIKPLVLETEGIDFQIPGATPYI
jgi:hypothetical protein